MLHLLRSIWIWSACAVLIFSWIPLLGVICLFDRNPLRLRTARWFRRLGRNLARVNPWRLHITGGENLRKDQVYVIVSNHQSLADIPLITYLRVDAKWMAKAELFRIPVIGWLFRMAKDIPVERTDRRKAAQAFLQAARYLRQRCSIIFFPEGTRSPNGEVLPFNDGPFQLAIREGVPILPLVVEGSGSALPRHSWIFSGRQDIHLRVLDPISVDGWRANETAQLNETVRQRMIDELHRLRGKGQ